MPKLPLLLAIIILPLSFATRADELLEAVNAGDVEAVDAALAEASSVDARGAALKAAVIARRVDLVERFVAAGMDVSAPLDERNRRALMLAASGGDRPMIDYLIGQGAALDDRDLTGDTAINYAVFRDHPESVQRLLDAGAAATYVGHGNAFEIGLRMGRESMLRLLARAVGYDCGDEPEPMMPDGEQLAERPALASQRNCFGRPLLHIAVLEGDTAAMTRLLDAGADVDARDPIGHTALMVAAREGRAGAVDLLIERGASLATIAAKRSLKFSVLHAAAVGGDPDIITSLIEAGAEIDRPDGDGVSPLFWTTGLGHEPAALAFIEAGADTETPHPRGHTMLELARFLGLNKVQKAIEERG